MTEDDQRPAPDHEPDPDQPDAAKTDDSTARARRPGDTADDLPSISDDTEIVPGRRLTDSDLGTDDTVADAPRLAGPTGTSMMPTVDGPADERPRWSARAQVPEAGAPHGDAPPDWPATQDWDAEQEPRGVLMPVLVAVAVLLLLALLGLGLVLLLGKQDPSPAGPEPVLTSVPVSPSRAGQTTSAPPPTTAPTTVTIPEVRGLTYEQAAAKLSAVGLVPVRLDELSSAEPAGRVIGTDPPSGTLRQGTPVTVLVAKALPTSEPAAPSPTPTS